MSTTLEKKSSGLNLKKKSSLSNSLRRVFGSISDFKKHGHSNIQVQDWSLVQEEKEKRIDEEEPRTSTSTNSSLSTPPRSSISSTSSPPPLIKRKRVAAFLPLPLQSRGKNVKGLSLPLILAPSHLADEDDSFSPTMINTPTPFNTSLRLEPVDVWENEFSQEVSRCSSNDSHSSADGSHALDTDESDYGFSKLSIGVWNNDSSPSISRESLEMPENKEKSERRATPLDFGLLLAS